MDKILKAARKLFSKNGFYQTSITDICRESNTAVGTFYIYFDDKTALYRCLMEDVQREIKDTINQALLKKNCTTRLEKEKEGLRAFVKYGAANHDMFEILWGKPDGRQKPFRGLLPLIRRKLYPLFVLRQTGAGRLRRRGLGSLSVYGNKQLPLLFAP